jgi:16S rRNA (guanine(966)-N(2))-methyltransferase RsmD
MSGLRVIGGKARGRKLKSVPGDSTRPITDRVREALFNIIGADIKGATFLDLFAGTGSVGIEALSRGASFVSFIDNNRQAVATIHTNLKVTGMQTGFEVVHKNAFKYLDQIPKHKYDYVYIAPPQYKELWKQALILIDNFPEWLIDDAWVIVQIHPKELEELVGEERLKNLVDFDQRRYGSTLLIFYQPKS